MGTIKIQCYKYHYKRWLPNGFIVEKTETTNKPKTNVQEKTKGVTKV